MLRLFSLFVVFIGFAGCVPDPVYRLESMTPSGTWYAGQQIIEQSTGGVTFEVAYVRSEAAIHTMSVRVTNETADSLLVDPAFFYYLAFPTVHAFEKEEAAGEVAALDPERELLALDLEASRAEARSRTEMGMQLALVAVEATAAAVDPPDTEDESAKTAARLDYATFQLEQTAWEAESASSAFSSRRVYWEQEMFRKTTLPPHTYAEGLVSFPVTSLLHAAAFRFPVGPVEGAFAYRQIVYRP
jgi:hypothetical protein